MASTWILFLLGTLSMWASRTTHSASIASYPLKRYLNDVATELPAQLDQLELLEPKYVQFTEDVPKSMELVAGRSVVLQCGANGIPPPNIHWIKDGRRIHQGAHENEDNLLEKLMNMGLVTLQNGVTVSKLKLDCVTKQTAGIYQCVAENGDDKIVSPPAFIDVIDVTGEDATLSCKDAKRASLDGAAPQIYMWTDSRLERAGASAQLFCRARGDPTPNIYWSNEGGDILKNGDRFTVLHNGDLIIKSVDWDLEGQYTCTASNEFGQDSVDTYLYPTLADKNDSDSSENVLGPI